MRFAAAMLVFATHSAQLLAVPAPPLEVGFVGVSFFFVLSGFVLAWSRRAGESVATFYWNRFARVWPATALVSVVLIALGARHESLVADLLLVHAWAAGGLYGVAANPPSWSLGTEAFFYAVFPLLVAWAWRRRRMALTAAIVVVSTVLATAILAPVLGDALRVYRFPPLRVGEFALGVVIAVSMRRGWRPRLGLPAATAIVAVAYGVGVGLWVAGAYVWAVNMLVAPTFALLVIAGAGRDLRGATTPAWLVTLGRWSFAFYLLHWPILEAARDYLDGVAAASVALVITLCLSGILFAFFERPVERWLRRRRWLRARTPATATARA